MQKEILESMVKVSVTGLHSSYHITDPETGIIKDLTPRTHKGTPMNRDEELIRAAS